MSSLLDHWITCHDAQLWNQVDHVGLSTSPVTTWWFVDKQWLVHVLDLHIVLLETNIKQVHQPCMGSYLPCFLWKIKLVQNVCVCVCNQVNLYIVFVLLSSACHFVNVTWFFSFGCRERLRCHSIIIILLHMFYVLFWLHKKTWREQVSGDTNCPSDICHQKRIKE